jgi:hypothetical protein
VGEGQQTADLVSVPGSRNPARPDPVHGMGVQGPRTVGQMLAADDAGEGLAQRHGGDGHPDQTQAPAGMRAGPGRNPSPQAG